MSPEPHEPETADFVIVPAHELQHGDVLLDLGTDLTGQILMLRNMDQSEPGDHGLVEITAMLAWREEDLLSTTIVADMLDLRVIQPRDIQ